MKFPSWLPLSLALHLLASVSMAAQKVYHNQFAVEVAGGDDLADAVALRHGLLNMGKVGDLTGHYLFQSQHLQKRFETKFCKKYFIISIQGSRAVSRNSG